MFYRITLNFLSILLLISSCAVVKDYQRRELTAGYYEFRQEDTRYQKMFIDPTDDTVKVYPMAGEAFIIVPSKDEFFRLRGLDVDAMTIGFKFRPSAQNVPHQLTANFNGDVFVGYRIDRFQIHFEETPAGLKKRNLHRAITFGVFGGIGSTNITPTTTFNRLTTEYEGFILSRGFAFMFGLNSVTVGLAMGWDHLADRDRDIWIYQNKPWTGLAVGLNIN